MRGERYRRGIQTQRNWTDNAKAKKEKDQQTHRQTIIHKSQLYKTKDRATWIPTKLWIGLI